jgi:hypothetical protein
VTGVNPEEAGLASGLFQTTLQVGEAIGLAVLTTISTTAAALDISRHSSQAVALTHGFSDAMLVGAGVLVGALLLAVFVLSNSANRAFVRLANSGDPTELKSEADALSEIEGIGAIAGLEAEHDVEIARVRASEPAVSGAEK